MRRNWRPSVSRPGGRGSSAPARPRRAAVYFREGDRLARGLEPTRVSFRKIAEHRPAVGVLSRDSWFHTTISREPLALSKNLHALQAPGRSPHGRLYFNRAGHGRKDAGHPDLRARIERVSRQSQSSDSANGARGVARIQRMRAILSARAERSDGYADSKRAQADRSRRRATA